ncbi:MAG: endonuclease domain-containing protein [Hyphomicrobiales bacterium]
MGVDRFDRTPAKTARARGLRKSMTDAEAKLRSHLRNNSMHEVAFRRQHPMGNYVLDFYSPAARLAIEVDGGQHNEEAHAIRDRRRDAWLAEKHILTLRFWNTDVLTSIDGVLETIWRAIDTRLTQGSTPTPTLPLLGGGGLKESQR